MNCDGHANQFQSLYFHQSYFLFYSFEKLNGNQNGFAVTVSDWRCKLTEFFCKLSWAYSRTSVTFARTRNECESSDFSLPTNHRKKGLRMKKETKAIDQLTKCTSATQIATGQIVRWRTDRSMATAPTDRMFRRMMSTTSMLLRKTKENILFQIIFDDVVLDLFSHVFLRLCKAFSLRTFLAFIIYKLPHCRIEYV